VPGQPVAGIGQDGLVRRAAPTIETIAKNPEISGVPLHLPVD
jgi:hypothetical protein